MRESDLASNCDTYLVPIECHNIVRLTSPFARYVGGLLLHELLKAIPDVFAARSAVVLPLAFSAKMDENKEVAGVWGQVWEEGVSSEAGAVRLYASEIVGSLVEGMASAQWSRKKSCAEAISQLTKVGWSSHMSDEIAS